MALPSVPLPEALYDSGVFSWQVPNPPGANPLVAERAFWRSSQSCVTGGQQPIVEIPTPPAEKITKLIRPTFFPVITDFRLPNFLVIVQN